MKRKIVFSLCAAVFLGFVTVYNHFKLYRFKDLILAELKTVFVLRNEKCAFNPMQMGGGI